MEIKHRGAWWHSPSILEPMPGPWAGYEIYGMETVDAWKRILDWHKENGLQLIITQISSHFRDRTMLGWGFQYVLDFDKHPETRSFSQEFVRRNAERMEKILGYARSLGVEIYLHHYNFMAPRRFVEAHPELFEKWKINANRPRSSDMGSARIICDRLRTLYGNLCWREPEYKQFMIDLWEELFQAFPQLAGILTTPGENQYCLCPACTRGARNYEPTELLRARSLIAHEFLGDFCQTFKSEMERHGKRGIFRLWGIKHAVETSEKVSEDLYPKGMPYMIKYHWFDCIDTGPDPLIADWIGRGYEVWVSHDLWGENAGPVQWNRPSYFRSFINECRRLGVAGVVSHQNNDWETACIPGWVQQLSLKCFCHYLRQPEEQDNDWITAAYEQKFGQAGREIRRWVEQLSDFVLNISKIVKIGGEGYTFSVEHPIYPGVGRIGNRVDKWVRGDLGEIADYIEYVRRNGYEEGLFGTLFPAEQDPFRLLDRMGRNAAEAAAALERMRELVPAEARGELEWLTTSARLCQHQAEEYIHASRVAVLREAFLSEEGKTGKCEIACLAIQHMEETIAALGRVREDVLELPTSSLDFGRVLKEPGEGSAIDFWHGLNIKFREDEYSRLREEMQDYLG